MAAYFLLVRKSRKESEVVWEGKRRAKKRTAALINPRMIFSQHQAIPRTKVAQSALFVARFAHAEAGWDIRINDKTKEHFSVPAQELALSSNSVAAA